LPTPTFDSGWRFCGAPYRWSNAAAFDLLLNRIERFWTSWRGRAIEPVVRQALMRLLPDDRFAQAEIVGGWWNRQNNPAIDLVGADREPVARSIQFLGSIKWLENQPFDSHDYGAQVRHMLAVPGANPETPLGRRITQWCHCRSSPCGVLGT
jgi:hypothetical protein